jgi:CMP-N,N'-diacetyllegionaminic acid synthase
LEVKTVILGIIPARGGSKGIKNKNLIPLNGIPLIQYTIREALNSNLSDLILTTDSVDIAKQYVPYKTILRPPELAQDETPMLPVIQHALGVYNKPVDAVMILQPTSPLRLAEDINKAIEEFLTYNINYADADSLVSVYNGIHPMKSYDYQCKPFFEYEPYDKHIHKCYTRNGAIFIVRKDLLDKGKLVGEKPLFHIMPKYRSIDIDDYEDLMLAEALLKRGDLN